MKLNWKDVADDNGYRRESHSRSPRSHEARHPDRCGALEAIDDENNDEAGSAKDASDVPCPRAPTPLLANVTPGPVPNEVISRVDATQQVSDDGSANSLSDG
jgi:hypothetical protein